MDFNEFIMEGYVVIVAVLYILGMFFKNAKFVADKYIPLILIGIGIGFCIAISYQNNATVLDGIIQGILCAGAAVLTNQLFKQATKKE